MPAPSLHDILGLLIWYSLAAGVLWLAERLHARGRPAWLTRKFVHVMAGLSVYELILVVEHWQWGLVPFATFIPINAWLTWGRPPASFGTDDRTPGPFYFAVVITALLAWSWPIGNEGFATAVLATMIFGDAAAALVGQHYGRRTYSVWEFTKTVEGSVAMLAVSFVACALTLVLLTDVSVPAALVWSFAIAAGTTVAEAFSPHGLDNVAVPVVGIAILGIFV